MKSYTFRLNVWPLLIIICKLLLIILCFVDPTSLYNLVNKANLVHSFFLVGLLLSIFINLYMFRSTMCPSSGETTVFMRRLVLVNSFQPR